MPTSPNGLWYPEDRRSPQPPDENEETPEAIPQLEITTAEGVFTLTPGDCFVRTFTTGDGEFDHIIHEVPETGRRIAIFMAGVDPLIKEFVETNCYPTREDDQPDDETFGYFAEAVAKTMGDTIEPGRE